MKQQPFTVKELSLPGVILITPELKRDTRGNSALTYTSEDFAALGIHARFVQDYVSYSARGVIRGFHFQRPPHAQDKLVRCTHGDIFDVAADCDPASPTFRKHVSVKLTGAEQSMLYIPGKYAHGYCVLGDEAIVEYKLSDTYHPELAGGVRFDDPLLAIVWPIKNPILSTQDTSWPSLRA